MDIVSSGFMIYSIMLSCPIQQKINAICFLVILFTHTVIYQGQQGYELKANNIIFLYWCFKNGGSFSWRGEAWQPQNQWDCFWEIASQEALTCVPYTHTHTLVCNGPLQWSMASDNCELTGPSLTDASGTAPLANTCGLSAHASMAWKVKLSFLQSSDHIHLPSNLILIKHRLWKKLLCLSWSSLTLIAWTGGRWWEMGTLFFCLPCSTEIVLCWSRRLAEGSNFFQTWPMFQLTGQLNGDVTDYLMWRNNHLSLSQCHPILLIATLQPVSWQEQKREKRSTVTNWAHELWQGTSKVKGVVNLFVGSFPYIYNEWGPNDANKQSVWHLCNISGLQCSQVCSIAAEFYTVAASFFFFFYCPWVRVISPTPQNTILTVGTSNIHS